MTDDRTQRALALLAAIGTGAAAIGVGIIFGNFVNGVAQALVHVREGGLANVRIHHGDALEVLRRVPDGSLTMLYLLHPDPWPKARHAKRRMVNHGPLDLIAAKLKPGGEFRFGTDHPIYCRWALMQMAKRSDFRWLGDTAADFLTRPADWPQTRYEAKGVRSPALAIYVGKTAAARSAACGRQADQSTTSGLTLHSRSQSD